MLCARTRVLQITEEDVDEQTLVGADEWLMRGRLARRLQQLEDAERAFRTAASWGNFPQVVSAVLSCVQL